MVLPTSLHAQGTDWPTKTVTVVVPFAAGGNTDVMARMASSRLSTELKQNFVVENRVGAAGALAAAYVAQAAPDGYTLLFGAAPQIAVVPRIQKVNYDPLKDLVPVSVFGTGPFILAINAAIPAKTMQEFVAYGKGKKLNYGSGGTGSIGHLSGALFVARAGLDSVHVPFKGGGPAMTSLVGGQIDMYFGNASEIIPHAESGKVRILGVATDKRMQQLPNVPTISELFPNFSLNSWNGFLAPAKTPQAIVDKLAQQVIAAARDPGDRRAADQARHRAERHHAAGVRRADRARAAAVRRGHQGRQHDAVGSASGVDGRRRRQPAFDIERIAKRVGCNADVGLLAAFGRRDHQQAGVQPMRLLGRAGRQVIDHRRANVRQRDHLAHRAALRRDLVGQRLFPEYRCDLHDGPRSLPTVAELLYA